MLKDAIHSCASVEITCPHAQRISNNARISPTELEPPIARDLH